MTVWISVLWKVSMQLPKKWPQWLKNGNFWNFFFLQNWKTQLSKYIWIYIIAFDTIEIQTQQAPQNGRRNLSFVKDTNVVGNRMTRKGPKMTISKGCLFNFRTDFKLNLISTIRSDQTRSPFQFVTFWGKFHFLGWLHWNHGCSTKLCCHIF